MPIKAHNLNLIKMKTLNIQTKAFLISVILMTILFSSMVLIHGFRSF